MEEDLRQSTSQEEDAKAADAGAGQAETEMNAYLAQVFHLPDVDYSQYSPLTLAYIGDDVFDTIIRTIAVGRGDKQASKLHAQVTKIVQAGTQAKMLEALKPHLTPEEASAARRGRNAKPYYNAKNASRREYLDATGFEALIGYLYLQKRYKRMIDLIALGLKETGHGI